MSTASLRTLIDDILLMVRNNNISESEDFSRAQIASWILAYKAHLLKLEEEKDEQEDDNPDSDADDSLTKSIGPLELIHEEADPKCCTKEFTKRTKEKIPGILGKSDYNIVQVTDAQGCPIQKMHEQRRHFHYFRKYTFGEMTWFYENEYIYVQGLADDDQLKYIYVQGIFDDDAENEDGTGTDEDDVKVPLWMVPRIKELIMRNELAFILRMPSDDSNNATLASVKPHGPQDQEE